MRRTRSAVKIGLKAALIGAVFSASAACVSGVHPVQPNLGLQPLATRNVAAEEAVRAFANAYNEGDLDAMLAVAARDIVWLDVKGENVTVAANGADNLRAVMSDYVNASAPPRSAVAILTSHGRFVTTLERAYYAVDGKETSQAAFAVYELNADKIRRVWYYPAEK